MPVEQYIPYETIDVVPTPTDVTKKVFVDGAWEDRRFVSVKYSLDLLGWLVKHHGKGRYGQTWWETYDCLYMWDKIYTHWRLSE